jgi:8-oxo-dGTP diphosphatase
MKVRPAALIIREGAVLTMRYRYGSGYVHVLPGGNPDPGESLPDALCRELSEELGIVVTLGDMVLAGEVLHFNGREDTLHCVFRADITSGDPALNKVNTSAEAIEWIAIAQLGSINLYPNFATRLTGGIPAKGFSYTGPLRQPYLGD